MLNLNLLSSPSAKGNNVSRIWGHLSLFIFHFLEGEVKYSFNFIKLNLVWFGRGV